MSDLMLMGVLRAPTPEPDNVLGIAQLADRARQAADEIEILIEYKKVSDSEAALAEAEIKHLEDALRLYGEHNPECGCWDKMDSGQLFARHDWQCTCGFREALDKEQT